MMEFGMESYNLAEFITDWSSTTRPGGPASSTQLWDGVNAHVRSFIFLNYTPQVINATRTQRALNIFNAL